MESQLPAVESIKSVINRVGLGRSSIFQLTREGRFPAPIELTPGRRGRRGYVSREVSEWIEARIRERDGTREAA